MLLLVGIIAIIVFTVQVYKTAVGTERNAPVWAAVTAITGITLQFVIPIFFGVAIAVYYLATGTAIEEVESEAFAPTLVVNIISFLLSIVAMVLIMKHVSKVKDEDPAARTPPPPPVSFGGHR